MKTFWRRTLPLFCVVFALGMPLVASAGALESTVWIEVTRDKDVKFLGIPLPRSGIGMGAVIGAGEIVTAAHVVLDAKTIVVLDAQLHAVAAEITHIDQDADIAVLRTAGPVGEPARMRQKVLARGERTAVVTLLRPTEPPQLVSGYVETTSWVSHGVPTPLIFPGMKGEKGQSGGGLYDEAGELAGIIIRIDGRLGYLYALPIRELCTRFKRCSWSA